MPLPNSLPYDDVSPSSPSSHLQSFPHQPFSFKVNVLSAADLSRRALLLQLFHVLEVLRYHSSPTKVVGQVLFFNWLLLLPMEQLLLPLPPCENPVESLPYFLKIYEERGNRVHLVLLY